MLTDRTICRAVAELYTGPAWWDFISNVGGVYAGMRVVEGYDLVVFRGSTTALDWWRDGISELASEISGWEDIGLVPLGFGEGMADVFSAITWRLGPRPRIITGHSLGAPHAAIYGAMLLHRGFRPTAIVTFGQPRPGMDKLKQTLAEVPQASYRNRDDPVTELPTDPPYCHPAPLIPISGPIVNTTFGPLVDHHIDNYLSALAGCDLANLAYPTL